MKTTEILIHIKMTVPEGKERQIAKEVRAAIDNLRPDAATQIVEFKHYVLIGSRVD